MKFKKGEFYFVNCKGPFEYNKYTGLAIYNGVLKKQPKRKDNLYQFFIQRHEGDKGELIDFVKDDIFCEM